MIERFGMGPRGSLAVAHGGVVYFAVTPPTPYHASVTEQVRGLLDKAEKRLTDTGSHKSRLLFAAIILADMADYDALNKVWDAWVDPANTPGRACFEARLASPEMKVEMIMVAARG